MITFTASLLALFTMLSLQSNGIFLYIATPPNGLSHLLIANTMIAVATGSLLY
ncbi:hypothetical protein [Rossellomorea marisflavi]|uniref:hypothetical protein n=1 Tax=Rossellomorea marisflavi TaxID=189381 RepID=UPI003D2EFAA7